LSLRSRRAPRDLHSFPTRRSSDLARPHFLVEHHLVLEVVQRPGKLRERVHLHVAADRGSRERNERLLGEASLQLIDETALRADRSEEHTSELQSRENLVCRLLLEK